MAQDYVTIRLEFVRLQQDAERLADRMKDLARDLRQTGTFNAEVEGELSQLLHDWDSLMDSLSSNESGVNETDSGEAHLLSGLAEKLDACQQRELAKVVLHNLQKVSFVDGTESAELSGLHDDARILEATIGEPASVPDIASLAQGTDAGNALLILIRDGDRLSDRECGELQAKVAANYGASLATAAVRGRLTIEGSPSAASEKVAEEVPSDPHVKVFVATGEGDVVERTSVDEDRITIQLSLANPFPGGSDEDECPADAHSFTDARGIDGSRGGLVRLALLHGDGADSVEPGELTEEVTDESIPDVSAELGKTQVHALICERPADRSGIGAAAIDEESDLHVFSEASVIENSKVAEPVPRSSKSSGGSVQESARGARDDLVLFRDQHISKVILHLAADDRVGLAANIARGQEARGELQVPFVPSWLLEALAFAPHVLFARGRLAAMIEIALSGYHERLGRDLSGDWQQGLGFFVRAATLRPSIVAPGTRAAAILKSFSLMDDHPELNNYCSRIAACGERLRGVMPVILGQEQVRLSRADHLRAFQAEVHNWSEMLREQTIGYLPANQLFLHANWSVRAGTSVRYSLHVRRWQKWQQTLRLSERIVRAVREGDSNRIPEVKAEVRRLSSRLREGGWPENDHEDNRDDKIRGPQPAMQDVLREAMTYAQRWVRLHSSSQEDADFSLPQAVKELRAEVIDRHDAVVRELESVRTLGSSMVVAAGAACLLRAVHHLREMFEPSDPIPLTESDPRQLLGIELLGIPDIHLNARWEPTTDPASLQDQILRFLADPQPDLQTVFQLRCEAGDRLATERLLEMDVWESAEQRDSFKELRDRTIQPTRASLMSELARFEQRLREIAHGESLADDQQALDQCVRRLRDTLGSGPLGVVSSSTFEWCRSEFAKLSDGLRSIRSRVSPELESGSPDPDGGLPDDHLLH